MPDYPKTKEPRYKGEYRLVRFTDGHNLLMAGLQWLREHPDDPNAPHVRQACKRWSELMNEPLIMKQSE